MQFENFQFLQPGWLLLLPITWLVIWAFLRRRYEQSMWERICDPHLLQQMTTGVTNRQTSHILGWILSIVLTLGIFAAAGPSWSRQTHFELESISARVLLLELSQSMLVEDVKPDRFTRALELARKIINTEFNGETGLVVYAGSAFVVSPLSRDANTLLAFLDALDPSTMPVDGTRVDLALYKAIDLLEASLSHSGQIFLIGTGPNEPDLAAQAALSAGQRGHRISIFAIGTSEGGPLKNPSGGLLRDAQGKFLLSKPDFAALERIADIAQGQMIRTAEAPVQAELYIKDSGLDKNLISGQENAQDQWIAANDGHWLIWGMLPLVILLFRKNQLWMLTIFCLPAFQQEAQASQWDHFWHHREHLAFDAYTQQDYQTAAELTGEPLLLGAAYYRAGEFQLALEAFSELESSDANYNRGNALAKLKRFPEAILAYDKALTQNPQHEEALYNKRLLEYFLEQQLGRSEDGDASEEDGAASEEDNGEDDQSRIGTAASETINPGEDPDAGAGLGVSISSGEVDLSENYDGIDRELERFTLTEGNYEAQEIEAVEAWIKALPQASSELFRRKFLRDYQRQTRQER